MVLADRTVIQLILEHMLEQENSDEGFPRSRVKDSNDVSILCSLKQLNLVCAGIQSSGARVLLCDQTGNRELFIWSVSHPLFAFDLGSRIFNRPFVQSSKRLAPIRELTSQIQELDSQGLEL